jgi:hypothetical protein
VSDIHGEGYGSSHDWQRDLTDIFGGEKGTRCVCRNGDAVFVHLYDVCPDIFLNMERAAGVPEQCKGPAS